MKKLTSCTLLAMMMTAMTTMTTSTAHADNISATLQACLDDNKSSGWHIIANENLCYTQDYQRQIKQTQRQISHAYQQLLALPMHQNKQATGSIKQMDKAWQNYRDNKCQLLQALALPFRRTQESTCELETTKNYLQEQKQLLQEIKETLEMDKELAGQ